MRDGEGRMIMSELIPNETILHYEILEKVGEGGMGVVYKAEDTKLKRTVALKFLAPHILATDDEKSRFVHEAQAAAALHHPNICTIYEINEAKERTFISMAYLEGRTLNEKLVHERLKPADAVKIALQIGRGLKTAHENGIVHRDIKSSNVMIGNEGRATIMDFGLAKSAQQTHVTQRGTKMGTIAYMSPEQARGDEVDHRTDIWSLGVLLYEMVTGQRPFRGDYDEAVIYSILNEEPRSLTDFVSEATLDLVYVVQKAIAKDPADRYRTADGMVQDLEVLYDELKAGSSASKVARANGIHKGKGEVATALFATRSRVTLVIYLVAAWVGVKLVSWSVNRFLLSPHLVSVAMVMLISLVPTVWILAARNGVGTRAWSLITRIGIPANIAVSLFVLFAVFGGRDIGAATERVAVRDETGETIERVVPKNEFRKSLALYLPTNESGDAGYDWAEPAIGALLEIDLSQDHFLYLRSGFDNGALQRLQRAGFSRWAEAPWNLKREMAEDANIDYLLTGSFMVESLGTEPRESLALQTRPGPGALQESLESPRSEEPMKGGGKAGDLVVVPEDATWEITLRVHDSRSGRLIGQNVHRGSDLFALVDEASVRLKTDLGIPGHHIDTAKDLPVAEMVTHSLPALALFSEGIDMALFRQEWYASLDPLERAVEYDSTFAYAHCLLYEFYTATNMEEKRDAAMEAAMRHIYKLPERVQFIIKAGYYGLAKQPEKALGVLELMTELYPDDIQARLLLAKLRRERGERDTAIGQYEKILEIDPSRTEFLNTIAWLYREKGDFDTAISKFQEYAEQHPDDPGVFHSIGGAYEIQGKYEEAREYYEKALVIDPGKATVLVELADIHGKLAEDEKARETFMQALDMSKTPQERARIYASLRNFHSNRGRMEKSLEHLRLNWEEEAKFLPPVAAQIEKLEDVCLFVRGGRETEAFEEMETMRAQLAPPYDGLLPLGYMCIYIELKDAEKTEKALRELETFIDTYQVESIRGWTLWGAARVAEFRGNYETAIEFYRKNLQLNPNKFTMHRDIGRCYRKLGENAEAIASLENILKIYPNNPTANYEAALAHREMGNDQKAMECLQKALTQLRGADDVYEPARKARATLEEWTS